MFDSCHLSHYRISPFLFGLGGLTTTCLHSNERYIISRSILCDGGHCKQHGFLFSSMALARRTCGSVLLRELRFCPIELRDYIEQADRKERSFPYEISCL
jgi:hypothetical protein